VGVCGVVTSQRWGLIGDKGGISCNNDLVEYNESAFCFALKTHDVLMQGGHNMNSAYYLSKVEPLTYREMEVLHLIGRGVVQPFDDLVQSNGTTDRYTASWGCTAALRPSPRQKKLDYLIQLQKHTQAGNHLRVQFSRPGHLVRCAGLSGRVDSQSLPRGCSEHRNQFFKTFGRACSLLTRSKLIATWMVFVRSSTKRHLRKRGLKGGRCH